MIVDHARGLHERIADSGTGELEATPCEILAHRVGMFATGGQLIRQPPAILEWPAFDELPDISIERTEFLLHREKRSRVLNCRVYLEPVAHYAFVRKQERDFGIVIAGYLAGVETIEQRAEVIGAHQVRLADGREIASRHILVATGARPEFLPFVEGLEHAITSNEIFDLATFPRRLLVVGGGYIAVEFASLFRRLGAEVTEIMRAGNILRGFDEDMRDGLREEMARAGVQFRFGCLPMRIGKSSTALRVDLSDGETLEVDQILIATGRRPNTSGLGLEAAGVALDPAGAVVVDQDSTTNVPSIHAVGDVTNRINLTPVAIREGHVLADHLFAGASAPADHHNVASAVFTTPEIGAVGLTERQAVERFAIVDIYKTNFRPMKATLTGGGERTIMKLVVDAASDRVLGAHIMGSEAGEMIQVLAIAIKMGARKADLDATMAVHPTAAEELVTMRKRTARIEREAPARLEASEPDPERVSMPISMPTML